MRNTACPTEAQQERLPMSLLTPQEMARDLVQKEESASDGHSTGFGCSRSATTRARDAQGFHPLRGVGPRLWREPDSLLSAAALGTRGKLGILTRF